VDKETAAKFDHLNYIAVEHGKRFDKIDKHNVGVTKILTAIQNKLAGRDSWNWIVKLLLAGVVGFSFYFIKGKI